MNKNLKLYLDLNNIENQDDIIQAGEIIEKHPSRELLSYSTKGYILQYFQKLVNNEIDIDEFLKLWDITSAYGIYKKWVFLESLFEIYAMLNDQDSRNKLKNSLILIEKYAYEYFKCYSAEKWNFINKEIHSLGSNICIL